MTNVCDIWSKISLLGVKRMTFELHETMVDTISYAPFAVQYQKVYYHQRPPQTH